MDDKVIWLVIKLPNIYDDGIHITKAFDSISAAQRYAAELNDTCFKNTDAKEPFTVERVEHRQEPVTLQSNLGTYSMRVRSAGGAESLPAPPFNIEHTVWEGDNIPANARIKDLDCSTPDPVPLTQPEKDYLYTHESPIRNPDWREHLAEGITNGQKYAEQDWYARNQTPNPGAGGVAPTLQSGTGGPVATDPITGTHCHVHKVARYPDGICPVCDYEKQREPMTLERAVAVLNEHRYSGFNTWAVNPHGTGVTVYGQSERFNQFAFEAIAIAEKLEREK